MLEELTARQWAEWVEFFSIEPWGFDVDDHMNAMIAVTAARVFGAEVEHKDFLLGPKIPERQIPEEPIDLHEQVKRMFGHRDYARPPSKVA
jgi:hypothetical protein